MKNSKVLWFGLIFILAAVPVVHAEDSAASDSGPAQNTASQTSATANEAAPAVPDAHLEDPGKADAPEARLDDQVKTESTTTSRKELIAQSEWDAYPIHAGDKIKINIHGEKELSDTYTVDVRGDIHFPLIEKIHAEGMSLNDFRESLRAALAKDYLTNPQVEMTFEESIFNSVTILGYVNKPGNYILPPKMTFLRMISIAGGFSTNAAYETCRVIRTSPEGIKSSTFVEVEKILKGEVADLELKPGDVVFVPKIASTLDEKENYVDSVAILGAVQKPGNYVISPGMTAIRVLSHAGGLLRGSEVSALTLTRKDASGKFSTTALNLKKIIAGEDVDVPIQAGDILYIAGSAKENNNAVDLSHSVTILGQVQKPSNYSFVPGMTLVQLVSEAGGFTPVANPSHVRITRQTENGGKRIMEFSIPAIIDGKINDVKLENGDLVYVPESVF